MFLINCMEGNDWIDACKNMACIPAEIGNITTFIYNAIRIIAPLILVLIGMYDMAKAITASKEDEIKKSQQLLVKRAVAAAIIFLLFSLITWMLDILSKNDPSASNVITCMNALFTKHGESTSHSESSKTCKANYNFGTIYGYESGHLIGNSMGGIEVYENTPIDVCFKPTTGNICTNFDTYGEGVIQSYEFENGKTHCVIIKNGRVYTIDIPYEN